VAILSSEGANMADWGSVAAGLLSDSDKYKLFATKIWPLLAKSREELATNSDSLDTDCDS